MPTDPYPRASVPTMLGRGLTRACARCGGRGLFTRWVAMRDNCPTCGHHFERSDGFWLGSIMLNNAVTFAAVLGTFAGFLIVGWPDPPWTVMLISVLAVALLVPIIFHPITRSLWVAMELSARPLEGAEVERAASQV